MDKPRFVPVANPAEIKRLMEQGKYREHLPFWVRAPDGGLWRVKQ